jgi:hypothetical protein
MYKEPRVFMEYVNASLLLEVLLHSSGHPKTLQSSFLEHNWASPGVLEWTHVLSWRGRQQSLQPKAPMTHHLFEKWPLLACSIPLSLSVN